GGQTKEDEPALQPWDILHIKIAGNRIDNVYGDSILRPVRRIWKQLKIMEDSVVLYRINRAPDRLVFYLDVGANAGPIEAQRVLNLWRQWFKKRQYYDPATGEYRAEYNPMSLDEDMFIATTQGSATKIDKMAGSGGIGDILDLEYFRDRVFAGLRIPKAYMGFEGDINAKATLAQQDIRYSRTIKRIQRAVIVGLTRLCQIHLAMKHEQDYVESAQFKVLMSPVSYLDELQKAELWNLKMDMAQRLAEVGLNVMMLERVAWLTYILSEFVGLPDKFIKQLVTMPGTGMEAPGGGGSAGAPMGLPGEDEMGDMGNMVPPPEGGGEMPPPEELGANAAQNFPPEEPFLAAPSLGMQMASNYVKPLADKDAKDAYIVKAGLQGHIKPGQEIIDVMRTWWYEDPRARKYQRIA
ncbi:MAG: portal protein, partial [bacterium]